MRMEMYGHGGAGGGRKGVVFELTPSCLLFIPFSVISITIHGNMDEFRRSGDGVGAGGGKEHRRVCPIRTVQARLEFYFHGRNLQWGCQIWKWAMNGRGCRWVGE